MAGVSYNQLLKKNYFYVDGYFSICQCMDPIRIDFMTMVVPPSPHTVVVFLCTYVCVCTCTHARAGQNIQIQSILFHGFEVPLVLSLSGPGVRSKTGRYP